MTLSSNGQQPSGKLFMFYPIETHGHINPLLGVADILKGRGHRTVFVCGSHIGSINHDLICLRDYQAKLDNQGADAEDNTESIDSVSDADKSLVGKLGQMSMVKKPDEVMGELFKNLVEVFKKNLTDPIFDTTLKQILDDVKPDAIVVDHGFVIPAIMSPSSPYKWCRIFSPNPLQLYSMRAPERFPAPFLGAPVTQATEDEIKKSWEIYINAIKVLREVGLEMARRAQIEFKSPLVHMCDSPYLNIYIYPEPLDYDKEFGGRVPDWVRCSSMVRCNKLNGSKPTLPKEMLDFMGGRDHQRKLIFLSMGTLASIDVSLMKRLVACLARSPNKFIISKGLNHKQYELSDNMWGDKYLPQKEILQIVDAAIIHGGNNSLTECLQYGVPGLIVCPMFCDQFDNARRVEEKGLGVRVMLSEPNSDESLLEAVEKVLHDDEMKANIKKVFQQMQTVKMDGPELAAHHIERVALS